MFDDLSCLVWPRTNYNLIKWKNKINKSTCVVSGVHVSTILKLGDHTSGQRCLRPRGQKTMKLKTFGSGGVIHVFLRHVIVKNGKNYPWTFSNGRNRAKFANRETAENHGKSVKTVIFIFLQNSKTRSFFKILT